MKMMIILGMMNLFEMKIYSFLDSSDKKYHFSFAEIDNSKCIIMSQTINGYYYQTRATRRVLENALSWRLSHPEFPEELRLYLKKFVKNMAFV